MSGAIAVAGATGTQGGATARALLRDGHPVCALTRSPGSAAAGELVRLGARVAYADFADRASLDAALAGCTALFAVTTPFTGGVEREVADGITLLEAAAATGTIEHVTLTSAANADRDTGIPHFDSKHRVERHLATLGIGWTVIAPAVFMEQYTKPPTPQGLRDGVFARAMAPGRPFTLIAAEDIGAFAARTLTSPAEFAGRRIDIASDVRTGKEIASILGAASGREVAFEEVPLEQVTARAPELGPMFRYFATVGLEVDVAGLRRDHPEIGWHSLAEWAARQNWDLLA
ncbi:NmrA family protein [Actinoplanes sp. ATCC 53533]|uniref:NmrA/HSCARG family protein n=1 Tax=Actinoplanes sp. ATCC 53533 TaxID=1288362 RepID=UPI000F76664D|nr:NmrA/HSCARG family protein [Actinoplanes sp. ATCC 53533]RSM51181.1 NmrA family protein [Actinoplanes sp. ATCC 53533]